VAVAWTLDLLLPPDIVQLKTDRALGVGREHFEAGEVIVREGDPGDRLYVVMRGEVAAVRQGPRGETPLRTLGPGEAFGEIALIRAMPRTATVRSRTAVDLLTVDRDAFQALFATLPELRRFFERLVEQRLSGGLSPPETR
jgi:CRP-like cAMP-binding protein